MNGPAKSFVFYTSVPLVELTGRAARNARQLAEEVERAEASSIFFHTHDYVREHHFLSQEYPSDFAYWAAEILQEKGLGERLAFVDIRQFTSIPALRAEILSILKSQGGKRAEREVLPGLEFHFRKSINIVVPTGYTAANLAEFRDGLSRVDNNSLHYHLIEAHLRDETPGNDFSNWVVECLGKEKLAAQIAQIDPYVNTLDQTRQKLLNLVDRELAKERVVTKLGSYPQTTGVGRLMKESEWFAKLRDFLGVKK
ncbi:MAG: DUF5752 family protein [candidate division Zixibacteria bacterium]|nr:DUF5752 family protein [candidate division Zixibacteria bacterium]MCI0595327.1 DUF5752 family protein [candidate division Zixibacteria bacterium]